MMRSTVEIGGGRSLDVLVAGPEDGIPLVFHHGTPGARLGFAPFVDAVIGRRLRFVSYSRPGYGASTRQPGRSVVDCAADVAALLDHLGAPRCYAIGWSGGGPHALACAAKIPERVIAAATIAGVAPYRAKGLDWFAGMGPENVEEFGAGVAGPERLVPFLETAAAGLRNVTGEQMVEAFGGLVSEVDKAALTGELSDFVAANFREGLSAGIWGWSDDDLAFVRDWGFDLSAIRVPVALWQGAQDRMVPFAHGEWLAAHVAGIRAHLEPKHGHLSLAVGAFGRILDDLIER